MCRLCGAQWTDTHMLLCRCEHVRTAWRVLSAQAKELANGLSVAAGGVDFAPADLDLRARIRVCVGFPPCVACVNPDSNNTQRRAPRIRADALSKRDRDWATAFYVQAATQMRMMMAAHGLVEAGRRRQNEA